MVSKAEQTFQEVYDKLSIEHNSVITREAFHLAVYQDIVEKCAMIASAHSPNSDDLGLIIRKTMGL